MLTPIFKLEYNQKNITKDVSDYVLNIEYSDFEHTWINVFADGKVMFAACVNQNGKKYNVPMDLINPME